MYYVYMLLLVLVYIVRYNNKEETIKWKDAGDFVYVILYIFG